VAPDAAVAADAVAAVADATVAAVDGHVAGAGAQSERKKPAKPRIEPPFIV
jgi:hypothetical protein